MRSSGSKHWNPLRVLASDHRERDAVTTFVPINDSGDPIKKGRALMPAGSMPIGRDRQPRQFPVAIPYDPRVYLVWGDAEPTRDQHEALELLCGKVTCVGHSASLVQVWIPSEIPQPVADEATARIDLYPTDSPTRYRLRVSTRGRLAVLESQFNRAAIDDYARLLRERDLATGKQKNAIKAEISDAILSNRNGCDRHQGAGRATTSQRRHRSILRFRTVIFNQG